MTKYLFLTIFTSLTLCLSTSITAQAQELSAKEIVKKADDKSRGLTSKGEMTLTIVRPTWTRTISMKSWSKGSQFSLIYITGPAKDKGMVFLKRHKDMWNWIPSIEKIVKIPPSMMSQSWMGSDCTNDDLVKESSVVVDYNQKLLGKEAIGGAMCYKIELIPLPDAAVTWGKVLTWISVEGFDQWKTEFYDEEMELVNVMTASVPKKMGDRTILTHLEIVPADKPGNKTVMEIQSVEFNTNIPDEFFSQQRMKTIK